jgi:hypothetical protein
MPHRFHLFPLLLLCSTCTGSLGTGTVSVLPIEDPGSILLQVNQLRQQHGSGPVAWRHDLAQEAQSWSYRQAAAATFVHSMSDYGENMMWETIGREVQPEASDASVARAVRLWYAENQWYDYDLNMFGVNTGHFTQLVWRSTNEIGAGAAWAPGTRRVVVTMLFSPPGNVVGAFGGNVMKPAQMPVTPSSTRSTREPGRPPSQEPGQRQDPPMSPSPKRPPKPLAMPRPMPSLKPSPKPPMGSPLPMPPPEHTSYTSGKEPVTQLGKNTTRRHQDHNPPPQPPQQGHGHLNSKSALVTIVATVLLALAWSSH